MYKLTSFDNCIQGVVLNDGEPEVWYNKDKIITEIAIMLDVSLDEARGALENLIKNRWFVGVSFIEDLVD